MVKKTEEISEAKIRVVKWELKKGGTKKDCCSYLGIPYNTKRLDKIIKDFDENQARLEELKKKARQKTYSPEDKKQIAKDYLEGESINSLVNRLYLTAPRVKNILKELNVPLRGKSKKEPAKIQHLSQNINYIFQKGEKAFSSSDNGLVEIMEVYDENKINEYEDIVRERYVELIKPKNEMSSLREGVHYEIYYELVNGEVIKRSALQHLRKRTQNHLEEWGQEYYLIYSINKKRYSYVKRSDLVPINWE